jgi:hypothetical protein
LWVRIPPAALTSLRSEKEVAEVKALAARGLNHCEISRQTEIPRSTIRREPGKARKLGRSCASCGHEPHVWSELPAHEYSYLLGMYLGDGTISKATRGVYKLRVFLDLRYPNVIAECAEAMRMVMPRNVVGVMSRAPKSNCAEVYCHSKSWPCLFPQHGPGLKHLRPIVLSDWQREIVEQHPKPLIRGLIHSDGCRVINRSMRRYFYVRYMFVNASADIRGIFCDACDRLGIPWRQSNTRTISVARRESVVRLDSFVGPKT